VRLRLDNGTPFGLGFSRILCPWSRDVFFCRAANSALFASPQRAFNRCMDLQRDSDLSDWRRRVRGGARDIAFAVALTIIAAGLIGVAWLGSAGAPDQRLGASSSKIAPR
jgi:hypothetical protein